MPRLLRDLIIGIIQIDHEESENHGPKSLRSSLRLQGSRHPKKIKIFKAKLGGVLLGIIKSTTRITKIVVPKIEDLSF